MSESDWTFLSDGLDSAAVDRGVTTGIPRPNGGSFFVFGFNSLVVGPGAVGLFTNQVNFAPHAKGVSIRGAVARLQSGGPTGFSPFLFASCGGTSLNDTGYMLGLADEDPYHVVLKKGVLATGVPDLAPDAPSNGILLRSVSTEAIATPPAWRHLRLDVIKNDNGDVLLQCFENDLVANPIGGAFDWQPIPGMEEFIDDTLQINSGSPPLLSGRSGFGVYIADVTRRVAFDHVQVLRQVA